VQWIARMGKIHDRIANGMGLMADDSGQVAYSIYREQGATAPGGVILLTHTPQAAKTACSPNGLR
jgi:hypothetical protein